MHAIIVDDEQIALENMERKLHAFSEITKLTAFRSPKAALDWLQENPADVAFLDIQMRQMQGLTLAKHVKELCPDCAIVFVTGHPQYAVDAIKLRASGYLLKPTAVEDIREELDYILTPQKRPVNKRQRIRVQCFGNFEVFADEMPMKFQYSKTKELLAYLVDRKGAFCSNGELMGILWEDSADISKRRSYFSNLCSDLMEVLDTAGCKETLHKQRGMMAIVPEKMDCDYFRWLAGDIEAINAYKGEYMTQYSWGEFTIGGMQTK